MALSTSVIVKGHECSCEFEIKIIMSETTNKFNISENITKKAEIIKLCHKHDQNIRSRFMNQMRRNNNPSLLETLNPILTDLSHDIKSA